MMNAGLKQGIERHLQQRNDKAFDHAFAKEWQSVFEFHGYRIGDKLTPEQIIDIATGQKRMNFGLEFESETSDDAISSLIPTLTEGENIMTRKEIVAKLEFRPNMQDSVEGIIECTDVLFDGKLLDWKHFRTLDSGVSFLKNPKINGDASRSPTFTHEEGYTQTTEYLTTLIEEDALFPSEEEITTSFEEHVNSKEMDTQIEDAIESTQEEITSKKSEDTIPAHQQRKLKAWQAIQTIASPANGELDESNYITLNDLAKAIKQVYPDVYKTLEGTKHCFSKLKNVLTQFGNVEVKKVGTQMGSQIIMGWTLGGLPFDAWVSETMTRDANGVIKVQDIKDFYLASCEGAELANPWPTKTLSTFNSHLRRFSFSPVKVDGEFVIKGWCWADGSSDKVVKSDYVAASNNTKFDIPQGSQPKSEATEDVVEKVETGPLNAGQAGPINPNSPSLSAVVAERDALKSEVEFLREIVRNFSTQSAAV